MARHSSLDLMAIERWKLVDREADIAMEVQIDTSLSLVEMTVPTDAYRELLKRAGFEVEVVGD